MTFGGSPAKTRVEASLDTAAAGFELEPLTDETLISRRSELGYRRAAPKSA